jgi:hypothetical protein
MADENKLVQTKGSFVIKGVIEGKDNPANNNGYNEGVVKNGESSGSKYRSIKFKVKTSNDNIIPVELFGMEKEKAYFYNKDEKKSVPVEWSKRHMPATNGYQLILPEYDFVEKINNEFKDGDVARIVGEFQFQTYKDNNGNEKRQTKFIIKKMYKSDDELNFNDEQFKEDNSFSQEVVINEVDVDNSEKKVYLSTYVIGYKEALSVANFEIDMYKANPVFVKNIKSLKIGDFIELKGKINYKVINEVVDGDWGIEVIRDYKKSLEVTGAKGESFVKSMYKEKDLIKEINVSAEIDWSKVAQTTGETKLPFDLE